MWIFLTTIVAVLAGCSTPSYYPVSFVDYEYEPYEVKGTGAIRGKLELNGVQKVGNIVYLTPVTSLGKQVIEEELINGAVPVVPHDSRYKDYLKMTQADSNGMFMFANLAGGSYYVYSSQDYLTIKLDYLLRSRRSLRSGAIGVEEVKVEDGKTTQLILNLRSK